MQEARGHVLFTFVAVPRKKSQFFVFFFRMFLIHSQLIYLPFREKPFKGQFAKRKTSVQLQRKCSLSYPSCSKRCCRGQRPFSWKYVLHYIKLLHLKTCFKHVYSNKVGSEDPEKNPEIVFSKQIQTKVSCSLDGDHSS